MDVITCFYVWCFPKYRYECRLHMRLIVGKFIKKIFPHFPPCYLQSGVDSRVGGGSSDG